MNFSQVRDQIMRHEGFVPHAYQDHLGYWTIGIGRLIDERRGGGISQAEAMMLLNNDIARVVRALEPIDGFTRAPEPIQQALVNMGFQLGIGGLLGFRRMWAAIDHADYETAAREALDSRWAQQTPERAEEIAEIIRRGGSEG